MIVGRRVTLLSKAGCHLCDDARAVISRVCGETGAEWTEIDVTSDPDLYQRYWEQVPVTFVDGEQHDYWRVDPDRLRAALRR